MTLRWHTRVYRQRQETWGAEDTRRLFDTLRSVGILLFAATESPMAHWIAPDGWRTENVSDIASVIGLVDRYGGGAISVQHHATMVGGYFDLFPNAMPGALSGSAEASYGNFGFSFDINALVDGSDRLIPDAMKLVYRASQTLAQATQCIYGLGDMIDDRLGSLSILEADLDHWYIPRLAWWNYFGAKYVARLGRDRFLGSGSWINFEHSQGFTVIMRPATGPLRASNEDISDIGLND